MKLILIFLTTVFLFGTQNTAFAIISKNSDAPFVSSSTATKVNTEQKPNFLQRLVAKRIAQKWKLSPQKGPITETQGDKLAKVGFGMVMAYIGITLLILLGLFARTSLGIFSGEFAFLILLLMTLIGFAGFIVSIVAITHENLTNKGKTFAGAGIVLYLIYVISALFLILRDY